MIVWSVFPWRGGKKQQTVPEEDVAWANARWPDVALSSRYGPPTLWPPSARTRSITSPVAEGIERIRRPYLCCEAACGLPRDGPKPVSWAPSRFLCTGGSVPWASSDCTIS